MGMFDNLICEVPLPDGWQPPKGCAFQTKDFDCQLVTHRITKDGRLMLSRVDRVEEVPKAERPYPDAPDDDFRSLCGSIRTHTSEHDANFHGIVNFYSSETIGYEPDDDYGPKGRPITKWHQYNAKFTDGQLVEIKVLEDTE